MFVDVYGAELPFVWRTLWRLGVPDRDLEDVAHDVFVVVHRKLVDYDPTRPLKPWLFGICFRVALPNTVFTKYCVPSVIPVGKVLEKTG